MRPPPIGYRFLAHNMPGTGFWIVYAVRDAQVFASREDDPRTVSSFSLDEVGYAECTDWQTIETAPRDGTAVDLWHCSGVREPDARWVQNVRRHLGRLETGWLTRDGTIYQASEFTHWKIEQGPTT